MGRERGRIAFRGEFRSPPAPPSPPRAQLAPRSLLRGAPAPDPSESLPAFGLLRLRRVSPALSHAPLHSDVLAQALCAAEMGEPLEIQRVPIRLVRELLGAMPRLRATVPYAALKLLARLVED